MDTCSWVFAPAGVLKNHCLGVEPNADGKMGWIFKVHH
jgi:hypothetical protein